MKSTQLLFLFIFFEFISVEAKDLSEVGLFYRCFSQLTQTVPSSKNSFLKEVKAGRITAIDACNKVLKLGNLTENNYEQYKIDPDGLAPLVFKNFQRIHSSWFMNKDFPTISWSGHSFDMKDLFDTSTPALYYTKALFSANGRASDVINSTEILYPIRTDMDPTKGAATSHVKSDFIFTNNFLFAAQGELKGIRSGVSTELSFPQNPIEKPFRPAGSVVVHENLGAGFLGNYVYRSLNLSPVNSGSEYKTDGATKMFRTWGKAFFTDALCRTLPVLREQDVASLVKSDSAISFRTSARCTVCHASQDQLAGLMRNHKIVYVANGDPTSLNKAQTRGGNFLATHSVTKSAEDQWPTSVDADYYQRPASGKLFFRNYQGILVEKNLANFQELGKITSELDDFYICTAKRYYQYFTGIDITLSDIPDEELSRMNSLERQHREIVIGLGKSLKTHQSLQRLINEIFNLRSYRKTDFGATSGVQ